jgi:imidazolonepropionase-like amidohydrolase
MSHLKRCLARMHERGVTVALGTDTPFPHLFPGFSVHDELAMYVDVGIAPVDALRSATSVGARVLGLDNRVGKVAVGLQADLLVVSGDPLTNIDAIAHGVCTIRAGQRFQPSDLLELARQSYDHQPDDPITCDLLKRVGNQASTSVASA